MRTFIDSQSLIQGIIIMAVNYVANVIGSAAFSALSKTRGSAKTLTAAQQTALAADVDVIVTACHNNATLAALEPGAAGTPQVQALRAAVESALDGVDIHGVLATDAAAVNLAVEIAALYTLSLAHMGSIA
jgi:hypothetical protein